MNNINKLTILTLLFLAMLSTMSNLAIITALPSFKIYFSEIENIEFISRLMITIPSLSIALSAPFIGHIIYKFGKKKSVVIALVIFSVAGSSGLYLNSLELLLVSRAFFGIAVASVMIVTTSLVGDYFTPDKRPKYMSLQNAFAAFGGIILVTGGGVLSDISWRYAFGIYLIGFLLLPLVLTQIKEIKKDEKSTTSNTEEKQNGNIVYIFLLAFVFMSVFFIMPTQVPFMLINKYEASGQFAGLIISTFLVSNALGGLLFAKIKKYFHFRIVFLVGVLFFGIGILGYGFVHNLNYFFIPAHIAGIGAGVMMTTITTWFLKFTTLETRVKNSGYYTSSLFLGQFASPIFFFNISNKMGVQEFFFALGIVLISIVSIMFLFMKLLNTLENLKRN